MKNILSVAACMAISAGAQAVPVYSTGFESPFVPGDLNGQQGWFADTGTIVNNAALAHSGSQYAQMTGTQIGTTAKQAWYGGASFVPSAPNTKVVMTCYAGIFNYSGTTAMTAGLDAYDSSANRIGLFYLTQDGGYGLLDGLGTGGASPGGVLTLEAYHKLQMIADFSNGEVEFIVDGLSVYCGNFNVTDFGSVDLHGTRSSTGTGGTDTQLRFDDYSIEVVPAPGALALIGMGGLVAARRRRA
ncbi:MAG: PEP-CTERM sorting domain-containing protein [Phycisphaeraceae bacterium]|nr:PEP-CTERM sorting domain-containing protein [Phycisphaeraceae bacterium]